MQPDPFAPRIGLPESGRKAIHLASVTTQRILVRFEPATICLLHRCFTNKVCEETHADQQWERLGTINQSRIKAFDSRRLLKFHSAPSHLCALLIWFRPMPNFTRSEPLRPSCVFVCTNRASTQHAQPLHVMRQNENAPQHFRHRDSNPGRSGEGRVS